MRLQRWKAIIYQADSHCQVSSPGIFMSDFLFMSVAIAAQGLAGSHHKLLGICSFLLSFTLWSFVILLSCFCKSEAIVVVARCQEELTAA